MAMLGNLTALLSTCYVARGWQLLEDEDFIYLCCNSRVVNVFNSHTPTLKAPNAIRAIEQRIVQMEALGDG